MGSETSSLRERIQGISKRPKAQKTLIPLQEQVFVWRYPFDTTQGLEFAERLPHQTKKYILGVLSASSVRLLFLTVYLGYGTLLI